MKMAIRFENQTERCTQKQTHRFTGLWVDHLTLVKVKLALVILWMEIEDTQIEN